MAINIDLSKKLSNGYEKPTIISDILLLEPGNWNSLNYTEEEIRKAFENTDWGNKDNYSLILDHADNPNEAVRNWSGYVKNLRVVDGGKLYGDLEVWNPLVAMYLTEAKAKFGISAKLKGTENKGKLKDFTFENFSIVTKPAVRTAYINLSQINSQDKQNGGNNMIEVQTLNEVELSEESQSEIELAKKKPCKVEEKPMQEELSDVELLEYTLNSDWTDFVKKMKGQNPDISFKDIAKAYKGKTNANKDLETLSDEELLEKFNVISSLLKKREKYPYPAQEEEKNEAAPEPKEEKKKDGDAEEEMKKKQEEDKKKKDEVDSLNSKCVEQENKIKELQATVEKLSAPDRKSVNLSATQSQEMTGDAFENMAKFLTRNQGLGGDRRIF